MSAAELATVVRSQAQTIALRTNDRGTDAPA